MASSRPRVVIIGAGFGGMRTAQHLKKAPVDILLIDRNNYHTFTPLLYQVATCGLDPSEIAYPIRSIFRKQANLQCLLATVTGIDSDAQEVIVMAHDVERREPYDHLVIATGSVTNFFNNTRIEQMSFEVKDLNSALHLRNHILSLFERSAWEDDPLTRESLMTLVVVGGGATGIETAGALYELYNFVLQRDYPHREIRARVVLIEASDRLLAVYPPRLRDAAVTQLESLGVEVLLNKAVESVGEHVIRLNDGTSIATHTLVWAAGVRSSPIADLLGVALARQGRIPVTPALHVVGKERIYAIGDIAYLEDEQGEPYPQLIQVAFQQGKLIAHNIINQLNGEPENTFRYNDLGIMATIGRRRAVAWPLYRIQLTGFLAWLTWLVLHLIWLMGFRNQAVVFFSWVWNYITYDRSVRIITDMHKPRPASSEKQSPD